MSAALPVSRFRLPHPPLCVVANADRDRGNKMKIILSRLFTDSRGPRLAPLRCRPRIQRHRHFRWWAIAALLLSVPALAGDLEQRLLELEQRLQQLERRVSNQAETIALKDQQLEQLRASSSKRSPEWTERIEIGGVVEVEAAYTEPYAGENESDLSVATAELDISARVSEQVSGEIVLLYEDGDSGVDVDVATITFAPVDSRWFATAGKFYLPFGVYESEMISDPLTLEIGESREDAIQFGYEDAGWLATAYVFNGTNKKDSGSDNRIDNWGGALGYAGAVGDLDLSATIGYLNDIGDSDGLQDVIAGTLGSNDIRDHVAAWYASARVDIDTLTLTGEVVSALDRFEPDEVAWDGGGARPMAWMLEASIGYDLFGKEARLALGYQMSKESLGLAIPEQRYVASLSMLLFDGTALSFELAREHDYSSRHASVDADGNVISGTGGKSNALTTQLAIEF